MAEQAEPGAGVGLEGVAGVSNEGDEGIGRIDGALVEVTADRSGSRFRGLDAQAGDSTGGDLEAGAAVGREVGDRWRLFPEDGLVRVRKQQVRG